MAVAEIMMRNGESFTFQGAVLPTTLTRTSCKCVGSNINPTANLFASATPPVGVKISGERSVYTFSETDAGIPAAIAAVSNAPVDVPAQ